MAQEHLDVVIVGAGISGIGAACHLQKKSAGRSYAILEGRADLGGTWDLFRYPGIRSDSDMYTLGYAFKPWTATKSIADGTDILNYLRETAGEHHIDQHIRYRHQVTSAAWSSTDKRWLVEIERGDGEALQISCNFLFMCSGYYNYKAGYTPDFTAMDQFSGTVLHPQHWDPAVEYADKNVVVIGSGATAVTLVPELAKTARSVTMLQRSPSYIVAAPAVDAFAAQLRKVFAEPIVYRLSRWKNVLMGMALYAYMKKNPARSRAILLKRVAAQLGPDFDIEHHFSPTYNPWDQRLCLVPDGDLFSAIAAGKATVVTDHIERFTPSGLSLKSGQQLSADIIVTATGLDMQLAGNIPLTVDGEAVIFADKTTYKGLAVNDVPNMAFAMGYTNASWTLKVDLTCDYVCRLLNHMALHDYRQCVPRFTGSAEDREDMLDFSSGYVQRALPFLPKQGKKRPWKLYQNVILDKLTMGYGTVADDSMEFS